MCIYGVIIIDSPKMRCKCYCGCKIPRQHGRRSWLFTDDCVHTSILRLKKTKTLTVSLCFQNKIPNIDAFIKTATLNLPCQLNSLQPGVGEDVPYYGESKDVVGATAIRRRRHLVRRGRGGDQNKQ